MPPMSGSTSRVSRSGRIVEYCCAHRVPCELLRVENDSHYLLARTRFLLPAEQGAFVAEPTILHHEDRLCVGMVVEVAFRIRTRHFMAEARVGPRRGVSLDNETRALARLLELRSGIQEAPRRLHYRLSVVAGPEVTCTLRPTGPGAGDVVPSVRTLHGMVANLSVGGLGLVLAGNVTKVMCVGQRYGLRFCLPDFEEPFALTGEIRHVRFIPEPETTIVGVRFVAGDDPVRFRRIRDELGRFIAAEQRRRLREQQGIR